ncbi:SRPBCC family protein [Jiangella asiatica]|uniref:SRPBCC family protein n=1 Tax=Jiangella asiatica TaxID=2530372 RepID=A0A4R5CVA2_9ACTN|nr:SRPBCC family protein [Jiangella asiatica]TDE03380.1 SRPBCC family protein [Jiangella asiatica]
MIEVSLRTPAIPAQLFAVLADGWSYAGWVVGASHIRAVDAAWPAVGCRIHHSVGPWPLSVQDATTVITVEPDAMIELNARMWPVGVARVRVTLRPAADGTEIVLGEELTDGPARLLPTTVQATLLRPRNMESLRRLETIALGRGGSRGPW